MTYSKDDKAKAASATQNQAIYVFLTFTSSVLLTVIQMKQSKKGGKTTLQWNYT